MIRGYHTGVGRALTDPLLTLPISPRHFTLGYHDRSLANILVDPETHEVTDITDWIGTQPGWEDIYPVFLLGREAEGEAEPLVSGDTNDLRVGRWGGWKKRSCVPRLTRNWVRHVSNSMQRAGSGGSLGSVWTGRGFRRKR